MAVKPVTGNHYLDDQPLRVKDWTIYHVQGLENLAVDNQPLTVNRMPTADLLCHLLNGLE